MMTHSQRQQLCLTCPLLQRFNRCPTLRFVPKKARPSFARALSSTLRSVLDENSEEAWLKLFMLPKCVLPSLKSKGRHFKHTPIKVLCDLWAKNEFSTLWNLAGSNARKAPSQQKHRNSKSLSDSVISLAKIGLHGKACRILLSDGLAPLNNSTWELLKSKHPSAPLPTPPDVSCTPLSLGPDFNILPILFSFPKGTAAGPSGLRVQHLIDAAQIPLPISIGSSLRDIVNLLAAGKAPLSVARFLVGGSLTALNKFKDGSPPDIRPIAVGETLRRLTGKCLCSLVKDKVSSFFEPHQFGVACSHGTEKVVHGLRKCIEEHWGDEDFVVLKANMRNAFNLISRQALLSECSTFFPELLPWARWCYGSHPYLWHPLGHLTSEAGVQQGDPLGPLFFALVLHKVIDANDADDDCLHLILQAWYLDDGVLAGPRQAVLRALSIIEDLGPPLGIFINLSKCELFSRSDISMFPPVMKASHVPHLDILGTPIGDYHFCTGFFAAKRAELTKLLSMLEDVSEVSSHKLDSLTHSSLYDSASPANKARLLSASASLATSWISALPLGEPGLHFDPREFRTAISWWLGLETTTASCCLLCPEIALDPLGHLALSCRRGGDVVLRHNQLRDVFVDICHKANLGVRIEAGSALTPDLSRSRPADALVNNWIGGSSAAFDVTVTSPLTPVSLQESSVTAGTAALLAEQRKHQANDPKCDTLGWKCIPLAVESYGNWGFEARQAFSHLASRLSFGIGHQKSKLLVDIYGRLNVTLVRCIARALLSRACNLF
ncbi:hypothetical protein EMCRGX_G034949 [Ephydatia muelleri]